MKIRGTKMTTILAGAFALALAAAPFAHADSYTVDPAHSTVLFKIRHLFTNVTGTFKSFDGKITFDEKQPQKSEVSGSIDTVSIDTGVTKRDEHLRSPEFFDAAKHPKITFKSAGVSDVDSSGKKGKVKGTLAMHGIEKPIVLEAAYLGKGPGMDGKERAGFRGTTTVNRKDFGLAWNKAIEAGGMMLGDDVTIEIDVEGVKE